MWGVVRYCISSSLADLGMGAKTLAALPRQMAMLSLWKGMTWLLSRRTELGVGLQVP